MMSVEDVGEVIASILRRPRQYYGKTLNLSAEALSMENIVDTFNRHFDNRKFTDPKVGYIVIAMEFCLFRRMN